MKILVAGCSFATQLTPIIQNYIPHATIVNVAASAAGNKFIADSVISQTLEQDFDVIYVSWSGLSRYDVTVSDISYFDDWGSKSNIKNTNYVFSGGIWNWDVPKHQFANLLFVGYHKLVERKELHYNSILEMIKLKSYLETKNTPFYFTTMINQFVNPLMESALQRNCEESATQFSEHLTMIEALEIDKWILKDGNGIFETMYDLGLIGTDGFHPNTEGYSKWVELFVERLREDKIL